MQRAAYTASAICRTDVQALVIQRSALVQLLAEDASLHELLLERIAQIASSRVSELGRLAIQSLATPPGNKLG